LKESGLGKHRGTRAVLNWRHGAGGKVGTSPRLPFLVTENSFQVAKRAGTRFKLYPGLSLRHVTSILGLSFIIHKARINTALLSWSE
jgi:hypothetical protein